MPDRGICRMAAVSAPELSSRLTTSNRKPSKSSRVTLASNWMRWMPTDENRSAHSHVRRSRSGSSAKNTVSPSSVKAAPGALPTRSLRSCHAPSTARRSVGCSSL